MSLHSIPCLVGGLRHREKKIKCDCKGGRTEIRQSNCVLECAWGDPPNKNERPLTAAAFAARIPIRRMADSLGFANQRENDSRWQAGAFATGQPIAAHLPTNLQHRSGQSVQQCRIHGRADQQRHVDQHGRQGCTARDNVFVERFWRTIKYEESICTPMKASAKHGNRSAATSPSTTQGDLTQPLTAVPRIKPTSTRCRSARQHNPGRRST